MKYLSRLLAHTRATMYSLLALFLGVLPALLAPEFAAADTRFEDPLRFKTIEEFIQGILQAFVYIALPAVAFFIVLSGFKFIAAQGDPSKLKTARDNFMHVVIGSALVLGAWAAAVLIKGTIDQLRG